MEKLFLEGTEDTPNIILDPENMTFEISGRSLPEDVVTFFQPVMEWLNALESSPIDGMVFSFKLEYFNTASSKMLLDILMMLETIFENGNDVKVKWYYAEMDEDMQEAGEEYEEMVDLTFEHITYEF